MRIGQTSIIVFVSKFISSALGFIATLYFARTLGAEILGYYALTITLVSWLKLSGDLGISGAVTKRISEGDEKNEYATVGVILIGALAVVLLTFTVLFQNRITSYVGVDVALFIVILTILGLGNSLINAILRGEKKVHISGILSPIKIGTRSVIQIGLVLTGFGLTGMLTGHAFGWAIAIIVGGIYISVSTQLPKREHFNEIYDYAKYSWLGGLKSRSFNDVDVLVLGAFVSSTLVGIYSVTWSISKFLTIFGIAIRQSLFPEISEADADNNEQYVSTLITDGLAYNGLILIPGLIGGVVLSEHILRIYGSEFERGSIILILLILASLFYGYQRHLLNSLNAIDRPDISFRVNVIFIGTNVTGNVVLVYWIGWVGAAIATVLSAVIGLILAYWLLRRQIAFVTPWDEIGRQWLAAVVMGGIVYTGVYIEDIYQFPINNFLIVAGLVGTGATTYFLMLLGISGRFRRTVLDNLPFEDLQLVG